MVESIRVGEGKYTQKDLQVYFMGLSTLGLYKDPFIEWHKENGFSFDRTSKNIGMSIDGLTNTFALEAGDIKKGTILEKSMPECRRLCYVAKYGLKDQGMKKFYNKTREMVRDGIISPNEFKTIEEAYLLRHVGTKYAQVCHEPSTLPEFPCSY